MVAFNAEVEQLQAEVAAGKLGGGAAIDRVGVWAFLGGGGRWPGLGAGPSQVKAQGLGPYLVAGVGSLGRLQGAHCLWSAACLHAGAWCHLPPVSWPPAAGGRHVS